jgi:small subunit ribosomal protein S1
MTINDGFLEERGEEETQIDESWWSAVMEEEDQHEPHASRQMGDHAERSEYLGKPEDWEWARGLYERDDTIELSVIGYNRGGLLVEAQSLRGFIPVSHLVAIQPAVEEEIRSEQLSAMVGTMLMLKVIEFDCDRGRLVFSERAALAGPGKRVELLSSLQAGECVCGKVTNITRFGVFVDLGGVEGLVHVSELSWGRVRHPGDVVKCGEEIEVQVLSVDQDQARVALSLKELLPDPWVTVEERYHVGEIVEGVVTNVVKFGAFVGIEKGLEGLIHVSELGDGSMLHPRNVVSEGETVRVRIIHINASGRRLGLSLRQVSQHTYQGEQDSLELTEDTDHLPSY